MELYRAVIEHPDGQDQVIALDRAIQRIHDYVTVTMSMGHTVRIDKGTTIEPDWRPHDRYAPTDPPPATPTE